MTTTHKKDNKKSSLTRFKTNKKQNQSRPVLKNVDPFPRNARRVNRSLRKTARPIRRRSRGRLGSRRRSLVTRPRRNRRRRRTFYRVKVRPFVL